MTEQTNNFDFELVSPERKLMSEKAWRVTIPGEEGDFGVLANHSALVSSIRPGVIEIISEQGKDATKVFVAGGFADVSASNCTILAEEATMVSDLNQEEVEKEISSLQEKIIATEDQIEATRCEKQLSIANAKLTALTGAIAA